MSVVARPSARHDDLLWAHANDDLVATLRDLIRIRSVDPQPEPGADGELLAARHIAGYLEDAGLRPEVVEPFPGRGSVGARLRGDGTGGEPLLLLSHLDVVPAPSDRWTHDPFAADVVDGYVWGRGAVDMKSMIALELSVIRMLADEARAAGRDPAADPIPGLRRDVLFASTADEESGGHEGAGWVVDNRPDWVQAAGALNECGGIAVTVGDRRIYPIQVAEKGFSVYRITVRGTFGHGSMPREDNAAVLAAEVIARLATPGPTRVTPVMDRFIGAVADALSEPIASVLRGLRDPDPAVSEASLRRLCEPAYARALRALLRDTISPDVVHAGVKYNVIPGEATVDIDCRVLPGTDEAGMRALIVERLGAELAAACSIENVVYGPPAESPADSPLFELLRSTVQDHDPNGIAVPVMAPFATDAKHLARIGVPTYGFSPLQVAAGEPFLERFHGVDERVGLDALRWGLPVLYDVVRRFCG